MRDPSLSNSFPGADGTPMAVLVGGDGRIASGVVTGAPAVLELLGASFASAA